MNIVKWILQVLIAVAFLFGAGYRLVTPYETLMVTEGTYWVEDLSPFQVQLISVLEILGAIGLILPMFVPKYRFFVPLAALGLTLTMVGAAALHISRGEPMILNLIFFLLSLAIVYLRWDFMKKPGSNTIHQT